MESVPQRGPAGERSNQPRMLRSRCFTLLEILVTIAVISVLVSLLAPSLRSARDRVNTVKCMSNMHQVGLAQGMYGNDFKIYVPVRLDLGASNQFWWVTIGRYLSTPNANMNPDGGSATNISYVLQCPSAKLKSIHGAACSYTMLWRTTVNVFTVPYEFPLKSRSSELVLMMDCGQWSLVPTSTMYGWSLFTVGTLDGYSVYDPATANDPVAVGLDEDSPAGRSEPRWRHNNDSSLNCLFVDGHVKNFKKGELLKRNVAFSFAND